ncbi:hypothetical protein, partial [Staphylococcus arlettae]|uniref:hypothetical protein n=1 Tax=Staphylococcus arlettae TaxID=29378 RepID=UPI003CFA7D3F
MPSARLIAGVKTRFPPGFTLKQITETQGNFAGRLAFRPARRIRPFMNKLLLVAAGGAVGSVARYLVGVGAL